MPTYGLRPEDVVTDAAGNVQTGQKLTLHATQADAQANVSPLATVTTSAGRWSVDVAQAPVWVRTAAGSVYEIQDFASKADQSAVDQLAANKLDKTEASSTYAKAGTVLRVPTVDTLPSFFVIGHRGSANLFPEGTVEAWKGSLSMDVDIIEAGDLYRLTDGGLLVMHDSTVDRTTNGSGASTAYNTPGVKRMKIDAGNWFGGGWGDLDVPTFDDALVALAGHAIIAIEIKDAGAAAIPAAQGVIDRVKRLGVERSVIGSNSGLGILQMFTDAGIPAMYSVFTMTGIATIAQLTAAKVEFATIDIALIKNGTGTAWVSEAQAAGIKVCAFTIDHQADYDAAVSAGLDGIYSNDPLYASRRYAGYRTAATNWHINGTWGHGMILANSGPFTAAQRGSFVGSPGAYRWKVPTNAFAYPGEINPVQNPTGSYTITVKAVVEALPSNTAQGAVLFVCAPNDSLTNIAGNIPASYMLKVRASGVCQAWKVDAAGTATAFAGSLSTTAWAIPTLSAGLTSGVAVTSLPVNALTVAVKAGHQFVLPTGQVATVSGAAAVGATAIPVNSITPNAAVTSGANLLPQVTLKATITPTTVTFTRDDEAAVGSLSMTDGTQRGGYVIGQHLTDNGGMSFASFTVS